MTPPTRFVSTAEPDPLYSATLREELRRARESPASPERARVTVGVEPKDRVQATLNRSFGVTGAALQSMIDSPRWSEAKRAELHAALKWEIEADKADPTAAMTPLSLVVKEAAVTQSNVGNLLANLGQRRLLIAYTAADYGERTLARYGRTDTMRSQTTVGFTSLPDLSPVSENATYTEMALATDFTTTAAVSKVGNLLPVTREVIANDDVQYITSYLDKAGEAAARTLARAIWTPWISNANAPDGVAWFHASHANLQSAAISTTEIQSAVSKLVAQRQPGSVERLGFQPRLGNLWLVVGTVDYVVAYASNKATTSALHSMFGPNHEHVLVNSLLTDTNDWGLHWDSRLIESVRVNFFMGNEEPTFDTEPDPLIDAGLSADRMVFKVSHKYSVSLVDHRGAVKAIVA